MKQDQFDKRVLRNKLIGCDGKCKLDPDGTIKKMLPELGKRTKLTDILKV